MDKSFENKIKEDLLKSGYGAEMKALRVFFKEGWDATGLYSYYDLDERRTRESDIEATITKYESNKDKVIAQTFFQIIAEVKKSEKPWVIFKEVPYWDWKLGEMWNSIISSSGFEINKKVTNSLSKYSLSSEMGWLGIGIHESFKKPNNTSNWHSAFISVCKACEYSLEQNGDSDSSYPHLFFIKPLLILEGTLLAAYIWKIMEKL